MPDPRFTPLEFGTVWRHITRMHRKAQHEEPLDLRCAVKPDVVEAASGHTFVVTLTCGPELTIPQGARLFLEVPASWEAHLGNTFRRGVHSVGTRQQIKTGYGAFTDAECTAEDVRLAVWGHTGRVADLVEVVVESGEVPPGESIRITLGALDGNQLQVQKHAQSAILAVAVDLQDDGDFRVPTKHPTVRVTGAWADRLRVFAPSVVAPGERFGFRILPVDIYALNAANHYHSVVEIRSEGAHNLPPRVGIESAAEPAGTVLKTHFHKPGPHHISVFDPTSGIAGKSNPVGVGFLDDRRIYFGDLHVQMWHSMGTGTTTEYYTRARDVAGLDFAAPANHYNQRFVLDDAIWRECVDTTNAFNAPGRFVALQGYEWGHGTGHKNVYVPDDDLDFFPFYATDDQPAPESPEALWDHLTGRRALTIPHHPKYCGHTDWKYQNRRFNRLVEICSKWGISEEGGPYCVQEALRMGHRVGFIGGTDSHYGLAGQGSYHVSDGNGVAAVVAPELTREAIWQALHDRRTYATTGDRILLDFTMDGHPMGSDLSTPFADNAPRRFRIRALGTDRIDKVEILRNNHVVFGIECYRDAFETVWEDEHPLRDLAITPTFAGDRPFVFYYARLVQQNRQRAWASPIWLTDTTSATI